MRKYFSAAAMAAGLAAMAVAGSASAATVVDNMGQLTANKSVNGSVTASYTPGTGGNPGVLTYDFGATGAEGAFSTSQASSTGALDLAFAFQIVGSSLSLVNADAINPLAAGNALGAPASIYVTSGLTGPTVLGASPFSHDAITNSNEAATPALTLQPGDYFEHITGTISPGTTAMPNTDINVGAFAAGAVPEPGEWALMLAGIGMIGGAMRLRRRQDASPAALRS